MNISHFSRGIPIIVGGCARSGTSLVRRILDSHRNIHCGPEVKFFRDFYCDYFDDPLRHLRFSTTARSILAEQELFDILGRAFVEIHERAALRAGKSRWADKAPENVLYLNDWGRLLGDDWRFVHVVRNPLDTLAAIRERSFPLSIPESLADRIVYYRDHLAAGLEFGDKHPDRYHRIVYEKLVKSPERAVTELMSWLGERFECQQLSFNLVPHQSGLEDPKIDATDQIHASSVGRWRAAFGNKEVREILVATEDLWRRVDSAGVYAHSDASRAEIQS